MSNSEISFGSASTKGSSTLSSEARAVFEKYEINEQYIPYFKKYKDFDLIILCDDSGSMMKRVSTGETRWQRLEKVGDSKLFGQFFFHFDFLFRCLRSSWTLHQY